AEAAVNPDQGALVVLQIDHLGAAGQHSRADNQVELVMHQPGVALRDQLDTEPAQRVEEPVTTRRQQTLEFAVAETETQLVAVNQDTLQEPHGCSSSKTPAGGRAWVDHAADCGVPLEPLPLPGFRRPEGRTSRRPPGSSQGGIRALRGSRWRCWPPCFASHRHAPTSAANSRGYASG